MTNFKLGWFGSEVNLRAELCWALPKCVGTLEGKIDGDFNAIVCVNCVDLGSDGIKLVRFFFSLGFLLPGLLNDVL